MHHGELHVNWTAFDQAVMAYSQVQSVTFGCTTSAWFYENEWQPFNESDKQSVVNGLPLLAETGKLLFSTPPPEMIWNIGKSWPEEKASEEENMSETIGGEGDALSEQRMSDRYIS